MNSTKGIIVFWLKEENLLHVPSILHLRCDVPIMSFPLSMNGRTWERSMAFSLQEQCLPNTINSRGCRTASKELSCPICQRRYEFGNALSRSFTSEYGISSLVFATMQKNEIVSLNGQIMVSSITSFCFLTTTLLESCRLPRLPLLTRLRTRRHLL